VQGEPWTNARALNLTAVEQDSALAGAEIDAAQRLIAVVVKARTEANVLGKDLVGESALLTTIQRARTHRDAGRRRLAKAASEFAELTKDVSSDRQGWAIAKNLSALRGRLSDLDSLLERLNAPEPERTKRWTAKAIVQRAQADGLRVVKARNDITIWNGKVGITLWEDGSATRADVSADLANRMTLQQAAGFLFRNKR
jgi:hypothetical protein